MSDQWCPMCGHAVLVFSGDEGTSHYEPDCERDECCGGLVHERSAAAGYGGLIAVAEAAKREGWPLHCATRTTCAEHIAEGDDQKDNWAFGLAHERSAGAAPLDNIEINGHQYVHVGGCSCQPPMKPIEVDWDAEGTDR